MATSGRRRRTPMVRGGAFKEWRWVPAGLCRRRRLGRGFCWLQTKVHHGQLGTGRMSSRTGLSGWPGSQTWGEASYCHKGCGSASAGQVEASKRGRIGAGEMLLSSHGEFIKAGRQLLRPWKQILGAPAEFPRRRQELSERFEQFLEPFKRFLEPCQQLLERSKKLLEPFEELVGGSEKNSWAAPTTSGTVQKTF